MPSVPKNKRRTAVRAAAIDNAASWLVAATLILLLGLPSRAGADANVAFPIPWLEQLLGFETWSVTEVHGVRSEDDVARSATLIAPAGEQFTIKLRPAAARDEFNNVPRYELAAYHVQRLFLEPEDYVVPPTFFRALSLESVRAGGEADLESTYPESEQVFFVVQYWLEDVSGPADPYDRARFEQDPGYAHHLANLNVLTYLIKHKDANLGNVLLSTDPESPRAFSVDNGIAFQSVESRQGRLWQNLRVPALPSRTVERLRALDLATLQEELLVLSEHRLDNGRYVPAEVSEALPSERGVRRENGTLQLGLTQSEIEDLYRRLTRLLRRIDRGRLQTL